MVEFMAQRNSLKKCDTLQRNPGSIPTPGHIHVNT